MYKKSLIVLFAGVILVGSSLLAYAARDPYNLLTKLSGSNDYFWYALLVDVPCSPRDKFREIVEVDGLGKFCVEMKQYDVIKAELREGKAWEPELFPHFQKHISNNTTAIDIGAHIGTHTLPLSRMVGPAGRVIAFEPQVKMYQELLTTLRLNDIKNVQTEFAALGDSTQIVTMDHPEIANEGSTALGKGGNLVELRTLDSYQLNNVSFIKIDVEGAELQVLRGAEETIKRNRPVMVVEIGGGYDYQSAPKKIQSFIRTTIQYLESLGYEVKQIARDDYLALPTSQT